jgi:hypothetical protein
MVSGENKCIAVEASCLEMERKVVRCPMASQDSELHPCDIIWVRAGLV